jgi:MFS family permease
VCTVLLYRNFFDDAGVFRAGLTGLGQVVAAIAAGGALAALATPTAYRHLGGVRWPAAMLGASGVFAVGLGLPYQPGWNVLAALLLGFTSQSVKISVDTLIQHHVPDAYRGRVFAIYDMLFNIALVLAALLTAAVLPETGHSPAAVVAIAVGWTVTAVLYLTTARRTTPSVPPPPGRARADRAPSAAPADADTPARRAGRVGRRAAP